MRVVLTDPPNLGPSAKYTEYKPWLLDNFFERLCSYCLIQNESVQVEHYVPKKFREELSHDPSNLLLGCPACNGPAGKWDYHPENPERKRRRQDLHGYTVIHVAREDLGELYELDTETGELRARGGSEEDRAVWNATTLFQLNRPFAVRQRMELLEFVNLAAALLDRPLLIQGEPRALASLNGLLDCIRKQRLLLDVFDVDLPTSVAAVLDE